MVEFDQNGPISGKFPHRRHKHNGRRRKPDREGTHRTGDHSRRTPEENHEQRSEYKSAN